MNEIIMSPAFVLIAAAFLLPLLRGHGRSMPLLLSPLLALWLIWRIPDGPALHVPFLGLDLVPVEGSTLARLFGTVFAGMAFAGGLFALKQKSVLELSAALAYAGGALGVVFSGDLFSLFIFWEVMAVASTLVIWANGPAAAAAGLRYAIVHFLGGVILLAGIAGEVAMTGSTDLQSMMLDRLPQWFVLAGVLVNAAAVPLSAWLPDAYPKASWSGMVFLSAFTTKTAVFVLIVLFQGTHILIWIGLAMIIYGTIHAILATDMRRLLAYSIVDQVGFMVVAVGIGTELALNGAAAHAFAHIIYKATLVMAAGSVLYVTGQDQLGEAGPSWRRMPVTAMSAVVGGLAISAFPFTSGFATKTMISEAAARQGLDLVWLVLQVASAAIVLHAGFRFPWMVFFWDTSTAEARDPPWNMRLAMGLCATLCLLIGIAPGPLYALLPFADVYAPYDLQHMASKLVLLAVGGVALAAMMRWFRPRGFALPDIDLLWRGQGLVFWRKQADAVADLLARWRQAVAATVLMALTSLTQSFGSTGVFGRSAPTGTMAFWTTVILAAFLAAGSYIRFG